MSDKDPYTYGEIRKKVEIKLNKEFPDATKDQLHLIRKLAPDVAEGTLTYDDAVEQIKDAE